MSFSTLFIRRPVATILLALGLSAAGILSYFILPVAALPTVDFPTVNVSAQLAGASPETMATAVATPLIKQFQTIAGIDNISARSSLGSTSITVQFALSRDIDSAAADIQAAIDTARRQLPDNMTSDPSYRKVNPADAPILLLSLRSDAMPLSQLDSIAENILSPAISTISGVAQAVVYGQQTYAVRVQVDPDKLAARGIGLDQIATALASANNQSPVGTLQNTAQSITIDARTQLTDAKGFKPLIVAMPNGRPLRLQDVATVTDGVQNDQQASWFDGGRAITLAIQRQPGANTVDIIDAIRAELPSIQAQLPASVTVSLMNDGSSQIRSAIGDVKFTLILTIGLVILVIYLFLGKLVSTLIPAVAVPLSLLGAFGCMYVLGYSIDNLSLLALTLSVGLVVDDAIVMLENIIHHVEQGETPFEAALKGSAEISGTIISMSVSLIAVFLPIVLMGGVVGRLFTEFGMVVSLSIAASALVSLTVTPMLAARLPANITNPPAKRSLAGVSERIFTATTRGYGKSVSWCLRHSVIIGLVFLASVGASAWLAVTLPTGFLPSEDTGQLSISTQGRQDIAFDAMTKLQEQAAAVVKASPDVEHVNSSIGSGANSAVNSGMMFVQLKPKEQRGDLNRTIGEIRRNLNAVVGLKSFVTPVQSLRLGGRSSQSQYQLVLQSLDQPTLGEWAGKLEAAMTKDRANFVGVATDLQNNALQARIRVDRDRAEQLGISAETLRSALGNGFGGQSVATIQSTGNSYDVIIEYDPNRDWTEELLSTIRFQSSGGTLVPLSSFATIVRQSGPVTVNQTGQLASITISFDTPAGVSLSQSTARIEALKSEINLPSTVLTSYAGTAKVFADSTSTTPYLLIAAVLTIYVVLGVLYESFLHPLTILSGLPAAALGALLALHVMGMELSIIALVGILMLIGIVKKNAIMMIDVGLQLMREHGMSPSDAIHEACVRRFRPIMMTTFCALLGTLPIALGHGASSELRQPLGVAVVGGLMVSQLLTLFITPVIFVAIENLSRRVFSQDGADTKSGNRPQANMPWPARNMTPAAGE